MPRPSRAYRAISRTATSLLPWIAPMIGGKFHRSVRARQGVLQRLAAWGAAGRDASRPLLWMHAPSVGEGLQAEAVLRLLRVRHPQWQLLFTHYSPSAELLAARQDVDLVEYLPWDTPAAARAALAAIRPTALVFVKLDLWPELACEAARRGVGVGIVAATVSAVSSRLRGPVRALLRPGYAAVAAAGAVSAADATHLAALGVPADRVEVLGDPRFDSVLEVIATTAADDPLLRFRQGPPVLIGGSTWPADESVILDAFREVRRVHPDARLILAPHEPTGAHLVGIRARARRLELPEPVLLDAADPMATFVLVDRVGVLARLYGAASLAVVGGGFGRSGVHSVIEPAGWGIPVGVGPQWQAGREAGLLASEGGAVILDREDPARQLAAWWSRLLRDRAERELMGRRAAGVVEAGRGSSVRQAALVEGLMANQRLRTATPS